MNTTYARQPVLPPIDGLAVEWIDQRPIDHWGAVFKAVTDRGLGALLLLAAFPILLVAALAIKLESQGPLLYRQRRHALDNRVFHIYKFRTMAWQSATPQSSLEQTQRNDHRITRVGRWLRASSIDELPQLLNVLRGEMSLVGPRPLAVEMRTEGLYCHEISQRYAHRHRVKPGMTGWAQVHGSRGATTTCDELAQRVHFDLEYIERWSPWLDLKILFMTVRVVVQGTNAF
jgi:exopolysaccharide biosynthesis polyprenyl glycosylphosphotransferase